MYTFKSKPSKKQDRRRQTTFIRLQVIDVMITTTVQQETAGEEAYIRPKSLWDVTQDTKSLLQLMEERWKERLATPPPAYGIRIG